MGYYEIMEQHPFEEQNEQILQPENDRELVRQAELQAAKAMAYAFADRLRNQLATAHGNSELLRPDNPNDSSNEIINALQGNLLNASQTIHNATQIRQLVYAKTPAGIPTRLDLDASRQPHSADLPKLGESQSLPKTEKGIHTEIPGTPERLLELVRFTLSEHAIQKLSIATAAAMLVNVRDPKFREGHATRMELYQDQAEEGVKIATNVIVDIIDIIDRGPNQELEIDESRGVPVIILQDKTDLKQSGSTPKPQI